jgi:hypothetical protein
MGDGACHSTVMPALVAGIHVFRRWIKQNVDGRSKSGHDEVWAFNRTQRALAVPALL